MTPALRTYIEAWLHKAENDLISVQRLLEIEPMILDIACFHCQQAIEKLLKAYLIYNDVDVDRTHNIIYLLSECANFDPIFSTINPLHINAYAVHGRYPDASLMPEVREAKSFYQLALRIKELVVQRIIFS